MSQPSILTEDEKKILEEEDTAEGEVVAQSPYSEDYEKDHPRHFLNEMIKIAVGADK